MLRSVILWSYIVAGPVALLVGVLFALKAWQLRRDQAPMDMTWWLMIGIAVAWLGTGANDIWFGASRWLVYHGYDPTNWRDFPIVLLFRAALMFGGAIHLYMIIREERCVKRALVSVVLYVVLAAVVIALTV